MRAHLGQNNFYKVLEVCVRLERTRCFNKKRIKYKYANLDVYKEILKYKKVSKEWEEEYKQMKFEKGEPLDFEIKSK